MNVFLWRIGFCILAEVRTYMYIPQIGSTQKSSYTYKYSLILVCIHGLWIHCFVCRPSEDTCKVKEDAGAWTLDCCDFSFGSQTLFTTRLDLIQRSLTQDLLCKSYAMHTYSSCKHFAPKYLLRGWKYYEDDKFMIQLLMCWCQREIEWEYRKGRLFTSNFLDCLIYSI